MQQPTVTAAQHLKPSHVFAGFYWPCNDRMSSQVSPTNTNKDVTGFPNKSGVIQPVWGVWNGFAHETQLNDILQSIVANDGHHRRMVTALRPVKQLRHKHHAHQNKSLHILKIVPLSPCGGYHCALLCHTDVVVHGLASRAAETVLKAPFMSDKVSTS